jgi:hypothetical protein
VLFHGATRVLHAFPFPFCFAHGLFRFSRSAGVVLSQPSDFLCLSFLLAAARIKQIDTLVVAVFDFLGHHSPFLLKAALLFLLQLALRSLPAAILFTPCFRLAGST